MRCPFCNSPMEEELLDYVTERDGQEIRLEDVPTWVCPQCDHTVVEDSVIETVEDMLDHLDTVQKGAEETKSEE